MQSVTQLSGLVGVNPIAVGAISVWLLGVMSFLMRKLPSKLYQFIRARFVVSVTISGLGESGLATIESVVIWFMGSDNAKTLRDFCLEPTTSEKRANRLSNYNPNKENAKGDTILGIGFKSTLFHFEGRIGWITRRGGKDTVTTNSAPEMVVSFIGNNPDIIYRFLEKVKRKDEVDEISIFINKGPDWKRIKTRKKRDINSVILADKIKSKIISDIKYFFNNKEWYSSRGMSYKVTYLFHGEPGTGKSSLIFALASYFSRPIYMVNVNNTTDEQFMNNINSVPENAFIVFEDMDVNTATAERKQEPKEEDNTQTSRLFSRLSMSTILNTLDGIASLDSNVVFITTNFVENIDAALTRRGRIDYIIEIPLLEDHEVREYIHLMYPNELCSDNVTFTPIAGCNLQSIFLEHKEDFSSFIKEVPCLTKNTLI